MAKPIIAVDVDDVLAASAAGWAAFSNQTWGTSLTVDDYDEDWAKMWQVDYATVVERARIIHGASEIVAGFEPDRQAEAVLRELKKQYDLVITTSRVAKHREATVQWLDHHFADIFSDIHLAGIYDVVTEGSLTMTKAELVKQVGAAYLIDDQVKHCFAAAQIGVQAVLFGDYGWNRMTQLPSGVTRCKDWQAVLEYFDGRS